jgi:DNA-binding transcriptional MerR regulator
MTESNYSIRELTDLADVSERTVRYYVALELLPKPEGHGRWSHYTEEHLSRLKLIRKLQEGHMPLSEIGEFIKALDAQEAEAKAAQRRGFGEKLRRGKGKDEKATPAAPEHEKDEEAPESPDEETPESPWWSFDPQAIADALLQQVRGAAAGAAEFPSHFVPRRERPAQSETADVGQRTRWERIVIAPGVELNVKVTRSGKQKAAVEALIERARELFPEKAQSPDDVA